MGPANRAVTERRATSLVIDIGGAYQSGRLPALG